MKQLMKQIKLTCKAIPVLWRFTRKIHQDKWTRATRRGFARELSKHLPGSALEIQGRNVL